MTKPTKKEPKTNNTDLYLKVFLVVAVLLAGSKFLLSQNPPENSDSSRDVFAKCLNDRGVIMYGVDTCEFCQAQKKMFGSSFEKINYVNCDFDKQICQEKQITAYPVWQINDKLVLGVETFDQLAKATNCLAPE